MRNILLPTIMLLLTGCALPSNRAAPPVVLEIEAALPEPEPYPVDRVWSARPDLDLLVGSHTLVSVPSLFTRLDVIERDSVGLKVHCSSCQGGVDGYVEEESVVLYHLPPEISAWSELPEFLLAVRDAAESRDLQSLRPVMAADFSFGFIGRQSPEDAFEVWRAEQFATLAQLPALLDRGVSTRDGRIWSAPPEFVQEVGYQGLRAGFRQRVDGRWEWIYLIRGIAAGG